MCAFRVVERGGYMQLLTAKYLTNFFNLVLINN